ncbi:redoxin domain-containing protein [Kroppenstedtia pulmonis]|uniref:Redoxin domain-containing protein n=1 Tax=Kroppenstedtia pulmonis TaxID=1380685 RepID=A0A7D3XI98_9BACL|nr:redoxin domain-containing protein [Kroppenstedtia pulmonis]
MREYAERIKQEDVFIVAVIPATGEQIRRFLEVFGPYPFPVLGDPKGEVFRSWGHYRRFSLRKLPKMIASLWNKEMPLFPKNRKERALVIEALRTQDIHQQGGTWLLSPEGQVLWKHLDREPWDHPTLEEVLEKIRFR